MRKLLASVLILAVSGPVLAHGSGVHASGTVSEITAAQISVHTPEGVKTFQLTSETRFVKQGSVARGSDARAGDRVVVHGNKVNGALQATDVRIGAPARK